MERKLGALISPTDLRDYKTNMKEVLAAVSNTSLPEEYSIFNKPTIKNQGAVNSCVAHSLSSALESSDLEDEDNNFSTGWIYGYRPARLLSTEKECI